MFQNINRKDAKSSPCPLQRGIRKERKVLNLSNIFFATFAQNLCVLAVKKAHPSPVTCHSSLVTKQ